MTNRKWILLLVLIIAPLSASSFFWFKGKEVKFIRLVWNSDPATTVDVGWSYGRGNKDDSTVYYDTVDHGNSKSQYQFKKKVDKSYLYKGMWNAFARIKNLKPNTKYYFLIKNKHSQSKRYWFKTTPNTMNAKLSAIAGGDSRNNRAARRRANLVVKKIRPDVVLFGGDMTDKGKKSQWADWFTDWETTFGDDGRITPIIVARGNHEWANFVLKFLFNTPKGVYYSTSFAGGLWRHYTLNSERSIAGAQLKWLKNDLKKFQKTHWKTAIYHKPMRPHVKRKREGKKVYKYWAPLFYKYRLNLAIESDSHTVKRTFPIRPSSQVGSDEGFIRDDKNGTVYIGEGCWGAPLRANDDKKSWTRAADSFNQVKWLIVDKNKIDIRTIKVDHAEQMATVDDLNRFEVPSGTVLWNPDGKDSVLTIKKRY